jgi:hypothetical protein
VLEAFAEGTFYVGQLRIERKYIKHGCFPHLQKSTGDKFTFYTKVTNTQLRGNSLDDADEESLNKNGPDEN